MTLTQSIKVAQEEVDLMFPNLNTGIVVDIKVLISAKMVSLFHSLKEQTSVEKKPHTQHAGCDDCGFNAARQEILDKWAALTKRT